MSEEIKGQKVTNFNGTEPGTDGTMVKYSFAGSPTDLFEHAPVAGEVRSMTITAQCTSGTHDKLTRDGTRRETSWAVREVVLGRQTTLPETKGQTAIDDEPPADDGQPDLFDGDTEPADEVEQIERAAAHNVADPFAAVELAVANNDDSAPDTDD